MPFNKGKWTTELIILGLVVGNLFWALLIYVTLDITPSDVLLEVRSSSIRMQAEIDDIRKKQIVVISRLDEQQAKLEVLQSKIQQSCQ